MTTPLPHRYEVVVDWESDRQGRVSSVGKRPLPGGPPPQFDGSDAVWSPEELLVSAAGLCLMTTFMTLASKAQLKVLSYQTRALGILDRTPDGFAFTSVTLDVRLRVPQADIERAEQMLRTAKKYCIISNSLRAPVTVEASVEAAAHAGVKRPRA